MSLVLLLSLSFLISHFSFLTLHFHFLSFFLFFFFRAKRICGPSLFTRKCATLLSKWPYLHRSAVFLTLALLVALSGCLSLELFLRVSPGVFWCLSKYLSLFHFIFLPYLFSSLPSLFSFPFSFTCLCVSLFLFFVSSCSSSLYSLACWL